MNYYLNDYLKESEDITRDLNKLIQNCEKGSKLIFKSNHTYTLGMIKLKSDIELYFEEGSKIIASNNIDDFNYISKESLILNNKETFMNCDYDGLPSKYFFYGKDIQNIKTTGGYIDGNEEIFYGNITENAIDGKFYPRIPIIYLENVKNFEIINTHIVKSGFWTVHLVGCDGGVINGVKIINNRKFLCTDGIDPDCSKNIVIKNCYIESADDCIVFKSTKYGSKYGDNENIKVFNCELKSTSAAIKFGTETIGKIHNIEINDIVIKDTNRGIAFQMRDGGEIYDIKFNNIKMETKRFSPREWWGKAEGIHISNLKRHTDSILGKIYNVNFNNISINGENGIFIYGENISRIIFDKIIIKLENKTNYEKNLYDIRPYDKDYEIKDKISVIYAYKSKDVTFKGFIYEIDENFKKWIYDIYTLLDVNNFIINKK